MGNIDLSKAKLPPIYKRNGKDCYLDPIREKLIYITPEETVRQQVISYLLDELKVPIGAIRVEEHLSHYGIKSRDRADIVIEKFNEEKQEMNPLVVIECKAPEVFLGENTGKQMIGYADALLCDFCMMTNGIETFCYYYDADKKQYVDVESLPDYVSMVKGKFVEAPTEATPTRLSFEEIPKHCREYDNADIGANTSDELAKVCVNLWECLLYPEHHLPAKQYTLFRVIEDYGVRLLNYGNAGGGQFYGAYRSFLIEYKDNTELVSIGISPYSTERKADIAKTSINVAIDNEKTTHHSLQLIVDDNVKVIGNKITFYHNGRIGISNIGSGKIDELRDLCMKEYPPIVDGNKFNLGTLVFDHLWNLDEPDVMNLIENLISYALIRDEYRAQVIREKKS